MAVWRLQSKTSAGHIGQYCRDHRVLAMGWSLQKLEPSQREAITTYDQYIHYAKEHHPSSPGVKQLLQLRPGDFVWMRHQGRYYMGHVTESSHWFFNSSEEAKQLDAANQLTDIEWVEYEQADESTVPGAISTAFIRGHTLQRIKKAGVEEFSKLVYNHEKGQQVYHVNLEQTEETFYELLSPSDCEDLLAMWLYQKYQYVCIPSTNKRATQLYECVLINPADGEHIYIQVKKGNVNINAEDYADLKGQVWFLTTSGQVEHASRFPNMHVVEPSELYNFAVENQNTHLLPPSIQAWFRLLREQKL